VHWVEPETGEVKRRTLARAEISAFFARRAAASLQPSSVWYRGNRAPGGG